MDMVFVNDMAVETSWYVYQSRLAYYSGQLEADDEVFVHGLPSEADFNVSAGVVSGNAHFASVEKADVIIGPRVQHPGGSTIELTNSLSGQTAWYVYGPNREELYHGDLGSGASATVSTVPDAKCLVEIIGKPTMALIAQTSASRGDAVTLALYLETPSQVSTPPAEE